MRKTNKIHQIKIRRKKQTFEIKNTLKIKLVNVSIKILNDLPNKK